MGEGEEREREKEKEEKRKKVAKNRDSRNKQDPALFVSSAPPDTIKREATEARG